MLRGPVRTCSALMLLICVIAQDVGDRCFLGDRSVGTCKHISGCKTAQIELQQRLRPVICGFDMTFPIVCCRNDNDNVLERAGNRISEEKCLEFRQLDVRTTISTTLAPNTAKFNAFAVGGVNARFEEFPHMAILGYGAGGDVEFQCGGSLISDQFVLTAAHCLESRELGAVSQVRIGDLDISSNEELAEPQNFTVSQTFPHPEYDFESFYNDIALIKLDRPVIYTKYVKPACLQSKFDLEHNNLTATGWGALTFGGTLHSFLQKVYLNSLPLENCQRTYRPQVRLPRGVDEELQICGGNLEAMMDTCQGDSGGPLQLQIQNYPMVHRVVGVTSFGSNCGLAPGIYTRVSRYISWIESVVWPN